MNVTKSPKWKTEVGKAEMESVKVETTLLKAAAEACLQSELGGSVSELKRLERLTWHNFSIFNDLLLKCKHQFWTLLRNI